MTRSALLAVWLGVGMLSPLGPARAGGDPGSQSGAQATTQSRLVSSVSRSPADRAAHVARLRGLYQKAPSAWPAASFDDGVERRELGTPTRDSAATPKPGTPEAALAELGKRLFFDPRLSGSGQLACASCHDPDLGWADGRTTSFGHNRKPLARNAPSILNTGARASLFWDGRAAGLEDQARMVMTNPDEMHSDDAVVVDRVAAIPAYADEFRETLGVVSPGLDEVARALAAFERTVVSGATRLDLFLAGRYDALSDQAVVGLHLFRTDARCINCHNGPLLTDDKFHNLGLTHYGRRFQDLGRYNVTKDPADVGRFRTPSLRNVTRTAPYMHNGLFDLDELLTLYNAGMVSERPRAGQDADPLFPTKSPLLRPLGLSREDLSDLKAFLASLEEPRRRVAAPRLPADP